MNAREAMIRQGEIASKLRAGKTSEQILDTEFPAIPWLVPGYIMPGFTLLAGAPKIGKSWLALGMACALAAGGRVFGEVKVERCEILFLALEDTERRVKDRLQKMWVRGSGRLHVRVQWPVGAAALDYLRAWFIEFPETRAVFIDTLQKISGVEDMNNYRETYAAVAGLKSIADKYGAAVVALHHTSKMMASDFVHTVNGSVGITGAADTVITMRRMRMQDDGALSITGRDVEEKEYGIHFDPGLGTWTLMDHVPRVTQWRKRDGKAMAAGD